MSPEIVKHAIAVMGFRAPRVLRAAIPIYKAAGFDIFLHLDRKANAEAYITELGDVSQECFSILDRHDIFWAGFSMVMAEIALLRHIVSLNAYDRISLVSDDSFPLLPPTALRNYFKSNIEYVMLRKLETGDPFLRRYDKFYFLDSYVTSPIGRDLELTEVTPAFLQQVGDMHKLMEEGKREVDIYYGSQWFSLTTNVALRVLWYFDNDHLLRRSFQYSAVPDEIFIQTIVGNWVPRYNVRGGPMYADWTSDPRPFVFSSEEQVRLRMTGDFAFFRKVAVGAAKILVDMRDRLLGLG